MTISERQLAVIGREFKGKCCATCEMAFPQRMVIDDLFGIRLSRDSCWCCRLDATVPLDHVPCDQWHEVPGWVRSGQETIGV